jgi:RHS repeat-associated protein
MFELGPHHKDAFALQGRRRLIDEAVAKLVQQGFQASYDDVGRTLVAAAETGGAESLLFDDSLRLSGIQRPSGRLTRIEYPGGAECVRTISPTGTVTEVEVRADGAHVELRQPGLASYQIEYDKLGRPTGVTYPSGGAYRAEWGPDNLPSRLTDRRGAAWNWKRHASTGHLEAIEDPLGRAVRFESNSDGLPTRLIDAAGRDHRFEYGDGTLSVTSSTGTTTRFATVEDGVVEARWGSDEGVRERLDAEQRLARAEDLYSDDFVAFDRDDQGRVTGEATPQGTITLAYNEAGRLARIEGGHADAPIEYEYDADGVVAAVVAWNGHRIKVQSDSDGRIVRVTHPGGIVEQRTLSSCGRPAQIDVTDAGRKSAFRQVFEYDSEERLVGLQEQIPAGRSRRFSYDAEGHLLAESEGAKDKPGHRWSHDLKGNVVSLDGAPVGIADDDRPISISGKAIDWNADGCAAHLPSLPEQPELWLQYGASQRLRSAKAGTASAVTFAYDPVGRRTAKMQGSHATRFRWCRHQMLREASIGADGDAVVREWLYLPESYTPIAMRETKRGLARTFSVHEDCRGAVAGLVDDAGRLVWHGHYDAFGSCRVTVDLVAQPWRLQGQYHDDETGLHYNQARYYAPALGHYLSRDPRWLEWEATNYSYGRNDPWNRADPSGGLAFLIPMAIGGVIGGVIGGIAAAATGGNIMAGIAGGAVGGAIGAIPGAGLLIGALAGAVGAAITDITASLMDGKEICVACVLKSAIAGAIGGLLGGVAAKALAAAGKALAPLAAKIGGAIKNSKLGSKGGALVQAAKVRAKNLFAKVQRRPSTCGPVSFATGSKFLVHEDFRLPGRIPIEFTRRYLSNDARDGWFGRGWSCLFSLELTVDETGIHFFDLDGRDLPLPHVDAGDSWMDPLEGVAIERDRAGRYSIRSKEAGLRYRFDPLPGADAQFRLAAIEDRNGNAIRLAYPTQTGAVLQEFVHRPLSARDANGRVWYFEWDRHSHLRRLSVTLPADPKREMEVARYGYNDAGDLTSAEVFDLRRFVYAWNQHMVVSYTLPDGAVFRQEWDKLTPAGKCIRSYAVDGTFDDRIAFADDGSEAIHTDVLGRVSRHYFDEHHLHTGSIDAAGHRTRNALDPNGNPTVTTDELGRETKTVFDARGNLVSRKDAAGAETKVEYGAFDLPIRVVDALGQVWSRSYDDHGNLIEAIDPLGQKTRFDYDTHGQLTRVVDAKGGVNTLAWSANGELVSYTDCSGKTTRFDHDAWGRPIGTIDALQQVSRQMLDALGRVVEQRDADNAVHRFEWDPMDRLSAYIDPLGATTGFKYDKGGRPVVRRNALGREVRYEYDQAGRLAKLFNEKGEPYRFAYDALDRLVEEIGFDGRIQRYGYNAAGELTRLIEPGGGETGPGRVTRFDRDALGRLVGKVSGDDVTATFAYDPLGRLLKAVNPVAATTFAYDPPG